MGGLPCLIRAPEPVVHRRSLGLTLMPWRQNRLVPQYALKRGEVSGGVAKRVLRHLGPGHKRRPLPRLVLAIGLQKPADILVDSLYLLVTLGVKIRGEADRDPQTFHERLSDSRRELGTPIRHYILRHPVVPEDLR